MIALTSKTAAQMKFNTGTIKYALFRFKQPTMIQKIETIKNTTVVTKLKLLFYFSKHNSAKIPHCTGLPLVIPTFFTKPMLITGNSSTRKDINILILNRKKVISGKTGEFTWLLFLKWYLNRTLFITMFSDTKLITN